MDKPLKEKPISIRCFPVLAVNPFVPTGIDYKTFIKRDHKSRLVTDEETGEKMALTSLDKKVTALKDETPYIKVFQPQVLRMGKLSNPGLKLLCFIMFRLKPNKDVIRVDVPDFLSASGYSETLNKLNHRNWTPYYRGVVELIEEGFIARSSQGETVFYINPNRFFNGNRIPLLDKPVTNPQSA